MMNSLQRAKRETKEVRKEEEGANCSLSAFKLNTFVRHCKPLELPSSLSRMRVGDAISRALCWHSCGTFNTDTNGAMIKICILCLIENSFGGKSKAIALSASNGISAISYIHTYIHTQHISSTLWRVHSLVIRETVFNDHNFVFKWKWKMSQHRNFNCLFCFAPIFQSRATFQFPYPPTRISRNFLSGYFWFLF